MSSPNLNQEPLFVDNPVNPESHLNWQQIDNNPVLQADLQARAEQVPLVDIQDRATRIIEALTELGRISSVGVGFLTAVETSSGDSIWARYRRGTLQVKENAKNKLSKREQRTKDLMGPATGYAALRQADVRLGLMSAHEINARAVHTWNRFTSRFSGPDNNDRRQEAKRLYSKQITAQKRIKRRHGLAE